MINHHMNASGRSQMVCSESREQVEVTNPVETQTGGEVVKVDELK